MKKYPPLGETNPDAPYKNADVTTGEKGSHPDAKAFEAMMLEIINAITRRKTETTSWATPF